MPQRLSFQLYSARNAPSLKGFLLDLARIGYREVEGYGGIYGNPAALRRHLDQAGLTMPTGHFDIAMLEDDRAAVLAIATVLGIRHIYAPYLAEELRPRTAAGYRKLGKRLAAIGAWARSEGFSFGWHNHDFEFVKLATGETPIEILFETDPLLDWECDVAWVARAKANPITWIRRYGARITAVHVKDIAAKGTGLDEDGWADLGQGTLNWPALFAALKASRTRHYIMEHDNPKDLARFARRSFAHVSKI